MIDAQLGFEFPAGTGRAAALLADLKPAQRDAATYPGGALVEAVPGSGKTRVLVARAVSLLAGDVEPRTLLMLTFSRRAVRELRERLRAALGGDCELPEIRTFHGLAARLLAVAGSAGTGRRLLDEPAAAAVFDAAVDRVEFTSFPCTVLRSPAIKAELLGAVDDLRRAQARALTILAKNAEAAGDRRVADLLALMQMQGGLRDQLRVADFDDLVARVVTLATDDAPFATLLRGRYTHVLVDEFQDTDPLQLELLRRLGGVLFGVGDAAQAIYGFRGVARHAMHEFANECGLARLRLEQSFRCPAEICEVAAQAFPRPPVVVSALRDAGHVEYLRAATSFDEAEIIADVVAAQLAAGTPPAEIAVLLRSAAPLAPLLEAALEERGIPYAGQAGALVVDDPLVDALMAGLSALAQPDEEASWQRLLLHPAFGLPPLPVRLACLPKAPASLADAVAVLASLPLRAGATLLDALPAAMDAWSGGDVVRAARAFAKRANLLGYALGFQENAARASAAQLERFIDALADVQGVHRDLGLPVTPAAVLAATLAGAGVWTAPIDLDVGGVRVLTIHGAKGLEFESVIIADAVDGRFPQTWRRGTLIEEGHRDRARACGVALGTSVGDHDDEERSLWFVAATRAKRRLLVTAPAFGSDGEPLQISRFVPIAQRRVLEIDEPKRAALRMRAAPAVPAAQTPSSIVVTRPIATSRVAEWFSCRRKFYYDSLLKLKSDERSLRAELGTLVHTVLERFHSKERDFRAVTFGAHAPWEARLIELRAVVWDEAPAAFATSAERTAAAFAADRYLRRYAVALEQDAIAEPFEVIDIERRVKYDIEGVGFSAQIDRVDRLSSGGLALRDYKTGRIDEKGDMRDAFPKFAELVAESDLAKQRPKANPQLGMYRHAEPRTRVVSYVYLGGRKHDQADKAVIDSLDRDRASDAAAFTAVDTAISKGFVRFLTLDPLTELEPTTDAWACRTCEFTDFCPGAQDPDE